MVDILLGKMGAYSVGAVGYVVLVTASSAFVQAFAPPDVFSARSQSSDVLTASSRSLIHLHSTKPQPIDPSGWPEKFPAKEHCSKCGLCETTFVSHVTDACAFLGGEFHDVHMVVHLVALLVRIKSKSNKFCVPFFKMVWLAILTDWKKPSMDVDAIHKI